MNTPFDFRHWSNRATDWSIDYKSSLENRPVRPAIEPGTVSAEIKNSAPETGEPMEEIFSDFERLIPDAMTHWQHPRFFAYFQSNSSPAAEVAEQLATAFASQCMLWQTSPAATELEIKMVDWLRQAVGLPDEFKGSFQDSASSSTLCAILTMREKALKFKGNQTGLFGGSPLRVYASGRTHSSIDKAMWIAGLGQDNLVKIPTGPGPLFPMDASALKAAIKKDRQAGLVPAGIVICVGGTSVGATDNVDEICAIAQQEGLYTHVDAAWAGSAMICPEFRDLWKGVENADSIVLNPHKWLGVPMECSLHLVREPELLVQTMAIQPEYLKTHGQDGLVNFSEWSVQLGRRFRALKVWFLMRYYGLGGLRDRIRNHVKWSQSLAAKLEKEPDFEVVTQPVLSLFSFRHIAPKDKDIDAHNIALVNAINNDGRIYLTQTAHDGMTAIRFVAGQFDMQQKDIEIAFDAILECARGLE